MASLRQLVYVDGQRKLGVDSLLLPWGPWRSNSGVRHVPSSAEPSSKPLHKL